MKKVFNLLPLFALFFVLSCSKESTETDLVSEIQKYGTFEKKEVTNSITIKNIEELNNFIENTKFNNKTQYCAQIKTNKSAPKNGSDPGDFICEWDFAGFGGTSYNGGSGSSSIVNFNFNAGGNLNGFTNVSASVSGMWASIYNLTITSQYNLGSSTRVFYFTTSYGINFGSTQGSGILTTTHKGKVWKSGGQCMIQFEY